MNVSFATVGRLAVDRTQDKSLVFHAQASLPYLLFAYCLAALFRNRRVRFVYDMHDLHEKPIQVVFNRKQNKTRIDRRESSLGRFLFSYLRGLLLRRQRVRLVFDIHDLLRGSTHGSLYLWFRYHLFHFFERFALRSRGIKAMTVSAGLARLVQKEHSASLPAVVRSVPGIGPAIHREDREPNLTQVVFFGRGERAPLELVARLAKSSVELHLYGRDMLRFIQTALDGDVEARRVIRYFGEYSPDNLSFLEQYTFLLLFKPDRSENFRYSLPNKLFQALTHGLTVIVSENFEEMIELLRDVPGAVEVWNEGESMEEVLARAREKRGSDYWPRTRRFLQNLHEDARRAYVSSCGRHEH